MSGSPPSNFGTQPTYQTSPTNFLLPSPLPPHSTAPSNASSTPPRRPTQSREVDRDTVIGHVLIDRKRFKCSKPACRNSTFGRLADLRRHHQAHHGGPNRTEYYCPVHGCQRSRHYKGGNGRSFGTRKDKCDEHIRNVHRRSEGAMGYSPGGGGGADEEDE